MNADNVGRLAISVLTLLMFGGFTAYVLLHGASDALQQLIAGALIAWAASVIGYYVGSSAGSAAKDKTITNLSAPPPKP